jgi:hypothetical protein
MPRTVRLWGKKRGERRTGSRGVASAGEGLFYGSLFVLGSLLLSVQLTTLFINPSAVPYQPGFGFWLALLVGLSSLVIGASGLVYTTLFISASVERRSAIAKRAAKLDLSSKPKPTTLELPTVPREANLIDSPGVTLAYRLPTAESPAWRVLATTGIVLLATPIGIASLVIAIDTWLAGDQNWIALLVGIPFVFGSYVSARYLFRQLWLTTVFGPTCVEISDLPLRPGGQYEIFLSQSGRFRLPGVRLCVVCEEEANFSQGTDIRTESHVVYEHPVFCREAVQVEPGYPLEVRSAFRLPPTAMHSFQSAHNAVRWKLLLTSTAPDSAPPFVRSFPLVVYPYVDGTR